MNPEAVRLYAVMCVWLGLGMVVSGWVSPVYEAMEAEVELPPLLGELASDPQGGQTFPLQMFLLGGALGAAAVVLSRRVQGRTGAPLHEEPER